MPESADPSRRRFLQFAGGAGVASALLPSPTHGQARDTKSAYVFFNPAEAAFIEAAVARLIPTDETGPGAIEAGVPSYIDRQLAGAWGAGERLYRSGPWQKGVPSQGYQLPFTPAELFRNALRAVNEDVRKANSGGLAKMSAADQDAYLKT